jgi:hypothetical protein
MLMLHHVVTPMSKNTTELSTEQRQIQETLVGKRLRVTTLPIGDRYIGNCTRVLFKAPSRREGQMSVTIVFEGDISYRLIPDTVVTGIVSGRVPRSLPTDQHQTRRVEVIR